MTIDITVPYAEPQRHHILHQEWERQGGGVLTPVPRLTLPRHGNGSYSVRLWTVKMADLVLQDICSDEVAGVCPREDRVTAVVQLRGAARFTVAQRRYDLAAGQVSVSANEPVWDWEVSVGSRGIMLVLPGPDVRLPKNRRPVAAEQETPPVRLLLAHLRTWASMHDELTPSASWAARSATLELFHGLLNDQVIDDEPFSAALVRAAMEWIDGRLLVDPDLSPSSVAASMNVSVRTLHRAFTSQAASIMGYVRERRLESARSDLMTTSLTVSEIAARWHFPDGSHFAKAYKKRFGEPPTARRSDRDSS